MRTSTNDEAAFADNLYPIIKEVIKVDPKRKGNFFVLPSFTHPKANTKTIADYFTAILPPNVGCLNITYPNRTVYENFNREGTTLGEYSLSVSTNKRHHKQTLMAINDMEEIAKTITTLMENEYVTSKK
jgi:hypothetical protein